MAYESLIKSLRSGRPTIVDLITAADVIESLAKKHANLVEMVRRPERTHVGCRACFGSGGKRNDPCTGCNGTGKVPKT